MRIEVVDEKEEGPVLVKVDPFKRQFGHLVGRSLTPGFEDVVMIKAAVDPEPR
jgi:hypothetical protein